MFDSVGNGEYVSLFPSYGSTSRTNDASYLVTSMPPCYLSSSNHDIVYDARFPMLTYLRNIAIFNYGRIVASVCYLMVRYHTNEFIQKRGLGILKAFAFNHIEVIAWTSYHRAFLYFV